MLSHICWGIRRHFKCSINTLLTYRKMTFDVPTNAGKHNGSNSASAHCKRDTKDSIFWLAQMCVMTFSNFPFLSDKTSFQMVRQTGCRFINCWPRWRKNKTFLHDHWVLSKNHKCWFTMSQLCGPQWPMAHSVYMAYEWWLVGFFRMVRWQD